jgi:hypothetical protein
VKSAATAREGAAAWPRNPQNPVLRNQSAVEENEYLTDAFAREAVAFIERHRFDLRPGDFDAQRLEASGGMFL